MVDDDLVEDLQEALRLTGEADSPERVQLSLALACQLYYAADRRPEATALVDHGLAMAQRLDDARADPLDCSQRLDRAVAFRTRLPASPSGRAGAGRGSEAR